MWDAYTINLLFAILLTIVGGVWSLAWWFSRKFDETKDVIYNKIDELERSIVSKLEYHERHDDQRFGQIKDDIWDIRIRNAARDGVLPPLRDKHV